MQENIEKDLWQLVATKYIQLKILAKDRLRENRRKHYCKLI